MKEIRKDDLKKRKTNLRVAVHQLKRDVASRSRNLDSSWLDLDRHVVVVVKIGC